MNCLPGLMYWKAVSGIFIHSLDVLHESSSYGEKDIAKCRKRILKFLQVAKEKVGLLCFLDTGIWNRKSEVNWTALVTNKEIYRCLLSGEKELDMAGLNECQTRNLLSLLVKLTACPCEDSGNVMAVIRRLKALDLVFDEIVANLGKYKKTVSHSVFFFLAREVSLLLVSVGLVNMSRFKDVIGLVNTGTFEVVIGFQNVA
eukprot:m.226161 g.226161  ORF g.226161 m.226161 type:complete len:201 (+) comp40024_c0_seq35:528-1130(+)